MPAPAGCSALSWVKRVVHEDRTSPRHLHVRLHDPDPVRVDAGRNGRIAEREFGPLRPGFGRQAERQSSIQYAQVDDAWTAQEIRQGGLQPDSIDRGKRHPERGALAMAAEPGAYDSGARHDEFQEKLLGADQRGVRPEVELEVVRPAGVAEGA